MLPKGMTKAAGHQGTSFARYSGLLMVFSIILVVFALTAMLAFMDMCNPILDGGNPVFFPTDSLTIPKELVKTCTRRFDPGGLSAFLGAAIAGLGTTTVFLYRENKRAAVANGDER